MTGPLHDVRVLELGHLVAGNLPGSLLADLGAEVLHVEDPERGEPMRHLGPSSDGTSLWWKVAGRNKRSVALDLRTDEGREQARHLAAEADVVVTNFRVATLERWGLDFDSLHARNAKVVVLHVSAFGATGPSRDVGGFGKTGEARSGAARLAHDAEGRPQFAGFLLSDAATALLGAAAVGMALYRRHHDPAFDGEWIDAALTEGIFRLLDREVAGLADDGRPGATVDALDIAGIFADDHHRRAGTIVTVEDPDLGAVRMPAPLPHFAQAPGAVRWTGPALAEAEDGRGWSEGARSG